ncbi:MAG: MFS transporter, partial [Candidatus Ornithospirochaeta sp.]
MNLFILSVFNQVAVASFSPYMQIILRNKGYSHSLCGVLLAICQLSAIIMPLLMSSLSDRAGRTKPFIVLSAALASLLALPYLISGNILVVALSSFLMNGFFWCINPLCDGFISRNLSGDSSRYGTIRAAGTMSYVTALVLAGLTGFPKEDSNRSILAGMLVFIPLMAIVASLVKENKTTGEKREKGKFFSFSWFPKRFYVFMAIVALTRIGQAVVERLLSAYMTENLNLGNKFLLFVALGAVFECFCMIFFGKLK